PAMVKLELTWPRGLRSAIWSGWGSEAGASPFALLRLAIQFEAAAVGADAGTAGAPAFNDSSAGNEKRCATGCCGAEDKSNPPSEPTPLPSPISSIAGITARGIPESRGAGVIGPSEEDAAIEAEEFVCGCCGARVPAATAKLAIGR